MSSLLYAGEACVAALSCRDGRSGSRGCRDLPPTYRSPSSGRAARRADPGRRLADPGSRSAVRQARRTPRPSTRRSWQSRGGDPADDLAHHGVRFLGAGVDFKNAEAGVRPALDPPFHHRPAGLGTTPWSGTLGRVTGAGSGVRGEAGARQDRDQGSGDVDVDPAQAAIAEIRGVEFPVVGRAIRDHLGLSARARLSDLVPRRTGRRRGEQQDGEEREHGDGRHRAEAPPRVRGSSQGSLHRSFSNRFRFRGSRSTEDTCARPPARGGVSASAARERGLSGAASRPWRSTNRLAS